MQLTLSGHPARHQFADELLAVAYHKRVREIRRRLAVVRDRHQMRDQRRGMYHAAWVGILVPPNLKAWWWQP